MRYIKFYAGRHGSTKLNEEHRYRSRSGISIDSAGMVSAKRMGEFLKDKGIKRIISSGITRAVETAHIISRGIGVPVFVDPRFGPIDVGNFIGKKKDGHPLTWYFSHRDDYIGSTGDSLNAFDAKQREVNASYFSLPQDECPIAILTHTSDLIAMKNWLTGETNQAEVDDVVEPGGMFAVYSDRTMKVVFGKAGHMVGVS